MQKSSFRVCFSSIIHRVSVKYVEFTGFANFSAFVDFMHFAYVVFCVYFRKKHIFALKSVFSLKMRISAKTYIFQIFASFGPASFTRKMLLPPRKPRISQDRLKDDGTKTWELMNCDI